MTPSPLLQLTFTIDAAHAGTLMAGALALNAKIDAVGLVQTVPYTKNTPKLTVNGGEKNGRHGPRGPYKKKTPIKANDLSYRERVKRRDAIREALTQVITEAGESGLPIEKAHAIFHSHGGHVGKGFGPVSRPFKRVGNRLFLKGS